MAKRSVNADASTGAVRLRDVRPEDLPVLCEHQLDPEASRMAAFDARDLPAFTAHWTKVLADASVRARVIVAGGEIAGDIVAWDGEDGERLVGYWIGRPFWGRGVATRALRMFLVEEPVRPLTARVAKHNPASVRVLEKCGFEVTAQEEGAPYQGAPVEEFVMTLYGERP